MNSPFIDFKATEITPEKQKLYFVEPNYIKKLISPKATLIFGERGSGKTTILKHIEKVFNNSDKLEYIGIYYRFETANVKALNNPEMTNEQNILAFSQSISAIIGKLLCGILVEIKSNKYISYANEESICKKMVSYIDIHDNIKAKSFLELAEIFEYIRRKTLINLQNGKAVCYFDYTTIISEFCSELRNEIIFNSTCFCVLLDEYENLTFSEQKVINSFIKASSYFLTYKVCMRPEGFLTKLTLADKEQLIFGHDYEKIDYVQDIVGNSNEVKDHLRKICCQRIKYFYDQNFIKYYENDLDIDNYLEIVDDETTIATWDRIEEYKDSLNEKLKQFIKKNGVEVFDNVIDLKLIFILLEKNYKFDEIVENLNDRTNKYKNWLHNYKHNIYFQIISECEQSKNYCGFETFIKLANSNTRTMLEILHYAFGDYNNHGLVYNKINVKQQTEAIVRVAKDSFEQINYIPINGYKTKNLVNALGNLFIECLKDKRAKKFEVNSFSIKATKMMSNDKMEELNSVLHDAIMWGVLIPTKANKVKNPGDIVYDGRDYVLHPIFSPYFGISYRKRQKCELKDIDVYSMLHPKPSSEIKDISKNINSEYIQQELELG